MTVFAIDACVAIGLSKPNLDSLRRVLRALERDNHQAIMSKQVLNETAYGDLSLYKEITGSKIFREVVVSDQSVEQMRGACTKHARLVIEAHDYSLVCAAEDKKADFLVSNDAQLRFVAAKYLEGKYGTDKSRMGIVHIGDFIHMLYAVAPHDFERDLNLSRSVALILGCYNHGELPRIPDAVKKYNWDVGRLVENFNPYLDGVNRCVREVCP